MDSYHSDPSSHHSLTSHVFTTSTTDFDATVPSHSEQQPAAQQQQQPLSGQGLATVSVPAASPAITKRKSPSGYLATSHDESNLDPSLVQSSSSSSAAAANKKQKLTTNGDHSLGQIGFGLNVPTSGVNGSSSPSDLPVLVPGTVAGASAVSLTMPDGSIQVNDNPPQDSQFGRAPKSARQRVSTVKAAEPANGTFSNGSHNSTIAAGAGAATGTASKVTKGKGRLAAKYEHARPVPLPEDILVASTSPINPLLSHGDLPVAPELTSVSTSNPDAVDILVAVDEPKPLKASSKTTKLTPAASVVVEPPTAHTSSSITKPTPASHSASTVPEASTSAAAASTSTLIANAAAGSSKTAEAVPESLITQQVIDASKVAPDSEKGRLGQQHACPYEGCEKSFVRKSDFLRHYRIHTGERPFTCPVPRCGKTFIQRSALTVHLRTHTGDKPLSCDLCSRAFSDSSSLARHRRVHSGEKRFHCKRCNQRQFSRKITLLRHLEICDGSGDLRHRARPAKKSSAKVHPSVTGTGSSAGEEDESYDEERDADGEADYENEEEFNAALVLAGGNAPPKRETPTKSSAEGEESQASGSGDGPAATATPSTKTRAGRAAAAAAFNATPGAKRDAPPVKNRKTRSSLPAAGAASASSPAATSEAAAPSTVPRAGRRAPRPGKSAPPASTLASTSKGKGKNAVASAPEAEAESEAAEEEPKEVEVKPSPTSKGGVAAAPVDEAKEGGEGGEEDKDVEAGARPPQEEKENGATTTKTATTDE
ncbi:BQ2448_5652 [Microbotryum intermedium]|uniref:BQ2448_5652 protein n=1 Tax=Microbotryum intermedium TaxID=269621 RepID=A0A238F7D5_9BASI|nr:BQ2448_5652 [Microbotryum intermedium]